LLVIARRLVQLASAAIYAALIPDLSFGTALYHCFVTASTVGYGDVAISTPEARLFACLHIVVSVSWLAALLSSVDTLRKQRESQLQRVETRPLAVPHGSSHRDLLRLAMRCWLSGCGAYVRLLRA